MNRVLVRWCRPSAHGEVYKKEWESLFLTEIFTRGLWQCTIGCGRCVCVCSLFFFHLLRCLVVNWLSVLAVSWFLEFRCIALWCCEVVPPCEISAPSLRTCENFFLCCCHATGEWCNCFDHTLRGCARGSALIQWLVLVIPLLVFVELRCGFTFQWLDIMFGHTCQVEIASQLFSNRDV